MQLILDRATSQLITSPGYTQPITTLRQTYGEGSRIEIYDTRDGAPVTPTGLEEFAFVIKAKGKYAAAAPILAGAPAFTWASDISRWVADIDYNVAALTAQLYTTTTSTDEQKYLELSAQLIWRTTSTAGQQRSQVIESFFVDNTIWKGSETFPTTGTPLEASSTAPGIPSATVLTADVTNNNGTANTIANITGLSAAVQYSQFYHFRAVIPYTSAATATGARFSITGPASPTYLAYRSSYPLTATTQTLNEGLTAYDTPSACNLNTLTTGNIAIVEGIIKPSASGTLQVRFASEISGSAIVAKAGAALYLTRLS